MNASTTLNIAFVTDGCVAKVGVLGVVEASDVGRSDATDHS